MKLDDFLMQKRIISNGKTILYNKQLGDNL